MNRIQFQAAITRMAQCKIGPHEAAALFAIGDGATAAEIAASCGIAPNLMRVRLMHLADKGFISRDVKRDDGSLIYRVSPRGAEVITRTLGEQ